MSDGVTARLWQSRGVLCRRQSQEVEILEVDKPFHLPERRVEEQERELYFQNHGIQVVERFDATRYGQEPEQSGLRIFTNYENFVLKINWNTIGVFQCGTRFYLRIYLYTGGVPYSVFEINIQTFICDGVTAHLW